MGWVLQIHGNRFNSNRNCLYVTRTECSFGARALYSIWMLVTKKREILVGSQLQGSSRYLSRKGISGPSQALGFCKGEASFPKLNHPPFWPPRPPFPLIAVTSLSGAGLCMAKKVCNCVKPKRHRESYSFQRPHVWPMRLSTTTNNVNSTSPIGIAVFYNQQ